MKMAKWKLDVWLVPMTLFAILSLSARSVSAGAFTWQGPGNIWSAPGNWTPAGGPPQVAGDTAAINSGPALTLDIDPTIDAFSMNSASAFLSITSHTLTVNGPSNLMQGRVLMTGGTWAGTGTLSLGASGFLTTTGPTSTIKNAIDLKGTLTISSTTATGGALALDKDLTNNGTVRLTAAGSNGRASLNINQQNGTLTNNGVIAHDGGHTDIAASVVNNSGGTINVAGDVVLGAFGTKSSNLGKISLANGSVLTLTGASFVNDRTSANTGMITGTGILDRRTIAQGGWTNKGVVKVAKELPSQAQSFQTLDVDQPGLLNFMGDYVQASSGELVIPINEGGVAGTDYSQLMITQGAALLDGLLTVTVANPPAISPTDIFTVLTADSGLSGFFANAPPDTNDISFLATNGGTFEVLYLRTANGASAVELTNFVSSVPQPSSLHLLLASGTAAGLWSLGRWGRRAFGRGGMPRRRASSRLRVRRAPSACTQRRNGSQRRERAVSMHFFGDWPELR